MRMGRKLLAALLCAAVLAAGCGLTVLAAVEAVPYIKYNWDPETQKMVRQDLTVTNYTELSGGETALLTGWYVAKGSLTYNGRLIVNGSVHLILADDCKIEAKQGIDVSMENSHEGGDGNTGMDTTPRSLVIYAQSEGERMGRMEAYSGDNAAIGGKESRSCGPLTIHGGRVTASTTGYGAAIGCGGIGTGTVTIYGGSVKADTSGAGAGIGGGCFGTGNVIIHGGSVKANASGTGAGIGGGSDGTGSVIILGGSVRASASDISAAIGSSYVGIDDSDEDDDGSPYCYVSIEGGSVTARADGNGAAIGGGYVDEDCSSIIDVNITGGSVTASAIGGGKSDGILNCTVSMGLTQDTDYVYAQSYSANNDTLILTEPLRILGQDGEFAGSTGTETFAGRVVIPASSSDTLLIFPDNADFTLPADLTEVGENAFQGISARTVRVPAGVTRVGANAFSGSGLKKIRFLGEDTSVDATAFAGCGDVWAYAIPGTDTWMSLFAIPGIDLLPMS